MNYRTLVLASCIALPVILNAQQASTSAPADAPAVKSPPKTLSATIEEVVSSEEAGYKAIAYVVRWHGIRVLVVDPLARSRLNAGDSLNFIVSHHEAGDHHLLSFIFMGLPCKCDDKSQPGPTQEGNAGAKTAVGLVEEVLSTAEDGYRFVSYIVQAQGSRIAVSDPLAQSHHAVGDSISFLALSNSAAGNPVMTFLAMPSEDKPPQAQLQPESTKSEQTGIVEEVLKTNIDGFGYNAYVLNSPGARIVVEEAPGAESHRVGDQIAYISQRIASPKSSQPGILRFELSAPEADKEADLNLSMTQETSTVTEILTTQSEGCRYVAYIVKWRGARVAVSDAFSNTHYAVGDRISFSVSRANLPNGRQLSFLLFNFDKNAVPQKQGT